MKYSMNVLYLPKNKTDIKKIILLLLLHAVGFSAAAQADVYSAQTIPDSLKKDADVVIRDEYYKLSVKDKNTAKYDVHQVITVMNEQAKSYLYFQTFSSSFVILDNAEIKIYDQSGIKKNSISKKEMTSLNYGDGLVPEGRVTYFNVNAPSYPITIELNYSYRFKGILSFPRYDMQSPWQSVQHSVYEVEVPASLGIRYRLVNTSQIPVETVNGDKLVYSWELKNLKAYRLEKHSGSEDYYEPAVLFAPNKFELDDYEGDMTSWKNFGAWIDKLYAKTTGLPEEKKQAYRDMVKDAKTDREKAAILYNYLQSNMRYVSIQLGIGGYRPFPASFVDSKKYGDCKALSNYLKSALDAVGIKSNLVIIQGSTTPRNVLDDFPANYFNHCILNIPQDKDTIWLECTSTTLPFGQLGPFTENRKAMMITENGGALVRNIHTDIEVNEQGGARVSASCLLYGDDRDEWLNRFHDLKEDEKKKFFINNVAWKNPDVFEISNSKEKEVPYTIQAKMNYEKMYSFNAGSKLFFDARLYPIFDEEIPETGNRLRDYYFTCPYQVIDTTTFHLPAGFTIDSKPKNKAVELPFAVYTSTYTWDAGNQKLTVISLLQIKDRVIKAGDYARLVDFKKQVLADVNEKIVVRK
jgi:transglutaminase-like putative cysteine protease